MALYQDLTPVPANYDESDRMDDLIDEMRSIQSLHSKGYSKSLNAFMIDTVEELASSLDAIKGLLMAQEPSGRRMRIITIRFD